MNDNYYDQIKDLLINNEITKKVKHYYKNKSDLETYYKVGKELNVAGKHYGEGIIKKYSIKLTHELGKGYTYTALSRMLNFYRLFSNVATLSQYLTWGHYLELLPLKDVNKINYYIRLCEIHKLSIRELRERIKSKEYERLPEDTKQKLINNKETNIKELVPEPIVIKCNSLDKNKISEKALQKIILEDIESFMKQLGVGYTFVGGEYKIKIGNNYNYIDLLLFNYIYNCFVVIELKVKQLKKEHIGQIQVYMNYIDQNIKSIYHDKTIGIILVKKNNEFIIEYSSDNRIISRSYEII